MPITRQTNEIKSVLMVDAGWSVYAIGDLDAQLSTVFSTASEKAIN